MRFNSLRPSDAIWWQIWVNIGSGNGFTWTNVDSSSVKSSDIHIRAISQEMMPQPSTTKNPFENYIYTIWMFPPAIDIIPTLLVVVYSNGKYTN